MYPAVTPLCPNTVLPSHGIQHFARSPNGAPISEEYDDDDDEPESPDDLMYSYIYSLPRWASIGYKNFTRENKARRCSVSRILSPKVFYFSIGKKQTVNQVHPTKMVIVALNQKTSG